jgi:putative transposase
LFPDRQYSFNRWVVKYNPQLQAAFHHRKRPVWSSGRMDETSMKVKGQWRYLYRAVDKTGGNVFRWIASL